MFYFIYYIVESWKLFSTVATSPYHVFVPSKVSMLKLMIDLIAAQKQHYCLSRILAELPVKKSTKYANL